ncbi:MAG: transketolase-like TK C-terminal-containing protein, partial [Mycobacteriales bacterium]
RLYLPISDAELEGELPPYYHPGEDSEEIAYLRERRALLGGSLPRRVVRAKPLPLPPRDAKAYTQMDAGSGKQAVATTMATVRIIKDLMKDEGIGARFVPIIPDEARTFGMDALFPTAKIYSPHGQRYDAVDRDLLLSYQESQQGQILHEGISEAGSMASALAAGTSYATHGEPMIPVFIFYSMFGFQRIGDQIWSMGDQLGRGFLLGATAGRTTLNGEGLQHQDGHSLLVAGTNPACVAYDPAFAFEVAAIVHEGLERMYGPDSEDVFYYLTVYNEPIHQPVRPEHVDEQQLLRGLYRYQVSALEKAPRAQVLASGTGMYAALRGAELLAGDWGIAADVWSAPSWTNLRREAMAADEHALLHPDDEPTVPWVREALADAEGPVVAVTDFMRAVPDQIAPWVRADWSSLGTDGFGRSDTRAALRRHFHVDGPSVAVAVLSALARRGEVKPEVVTEAAERYRLDDDTVADLGSAAEGGAT